MNTPMQVKSMPPIRLSTLRAATTRACEAGPAPVQRVLVKETIKSPRRVESDKLMAETRKTLRDMPFDAAMRTVKRMNAKAQAQRFPREQRDAAEKLLNIING